jgi:hypothetical protein
MGTHVRKGSFFLGQGRGQHTPILVALLTGEKSLLESSLGKARFLSHTLLQITDALFTHGESAPDFHRSVVTSI